jgi:hypothetical protein
MVQESIVVRAGARRLRQAISSASIAQPATSSAPRQQRGVAQPRQVQPSDAEKPETGRAHQAQRRRRGQMARAGASRQQTLPAVVVPGQQVRVREQHQPGDDLRPAKVDRDRDHEDVHDDRQVERRAERRRPRKQQQQRRAELGGADEAVELRRREEAVEEMPDGRRHRQRGEALAHQLHESRRQERQREQHARDRREQHQRA